MTHWQLATASTSAAKVAILPSTPKFQRPTASTSTPTNELIADWSHHGRAVAGARPYASYILSRRPYFICDNYVLDRPLGEVRGLDDAGLRRLRAFLPAQRDFLRDPSVAGSYQIDPLAPLDGTCLRRLDDPLATP